MQSSIIEALAPTRRMERSNGQTSFEKKSDFASLLAETLIQPHDSQIDTKRESPLPSPLSRARRDSSASDDRNAIADERGFKSVEPEDDEERADLQTPGYYDPDSGASEQDTAAQGAFSASTTPDESAEISEIDDAANEDTSESAAQSSEQDSEPANGQVAFELSAAQAETIGLALLAENSNEGTEPATDALAALSSAAEAAQDTASVGDSANLPEASQTDAASEQPATESANDKSPATVAGEDAFHSDADTSENAAEAPAQTEEPQSSPIVASLKENVRKEAAGADIAARQVADNPASTIAHVSANDAAAEKNRSEERSTLSEKEAAEPEQMAVAEETAPPQANDAGLIEDGGENDASPEQQTSMTERETAKALGEAKTSYASIAESKEQILAGGQAKAIASNSEAGNSSQTISRLERFQDLIENVGKHALFLAKNGGKEMTITLIPRELGKVVLSCLEMGNQLSVRIQAESGAASELLQRQEAAIKTVLEQNGYALANFDVSAQGNNDGEDGRHTKRGVSEELEEDFQLYPGKALAMTPAAEATEAGEMANENGSFWAVA